MEGGREKQVEKRETWGWGEGGCRKELREIEGEIEEEARRGKRKREREGR